jgi:lipopolysaccharide heptosyltransferase III
MSAPTVLVFRTGQLGDTIVSIAAVRAIRAAHPGARLVLLTDRQRLIQTVDAWDVLGPTGLLEDVLYLPVPWTLTDLVRARAAIRALDAERLYYLTPMPRTSWQVWRDRFFFQALCGVEHIIGLRATPAYPVRDRGRRLTRIESESNRLRASIAGETISAAPAPMDYRLSPSPVHRERAAEWLAAMTGSRLIAFAPGSKMPAKRWPLERFAAAGAELLSRYPDVRLLVLGGGAAEEQAAATLTATWGARSVNLVGLPIWDTAAVLERCSLYVGNDTGTMHLAASVGVPCVAIFSARDNPGRWEPSGSGHIVLRREVPCEGCVLADCVEHQKICLTSIGVDEVVAAAVACLQAASNAA